jgi:hypothetical protein
VDWNIVVLNVNRPPGIDGYLPLSDPTIKENETQEFSVTASDPDREDTGLSYAWFLDGKIVPDAAGNNFTYVTDFLSTGDHRVKVVVSDRSNATDSKSWKVTVDFVNRPPVLIGWSPNADLTITETASAEFSVAPADPDKNQTLTVRWYLDDVPVLFGNSFVYATDYNSSGVHFIRATVSDGDLTVSHQFTVTVLNLNRIPVASIDSPADRSEYMNGDIVHFSGKSSYDPDGSPLTYSWKEGGVNVSDQMEFDRAFSPGIHTIVLEVRDGSGGTSSTAVRFRIRYIELSTFVEVDRLDLRSGDRVSVIITTSNTGDAAAANLSLTVTVDGKNIGSSTITGIDAGRAHKETYEWKTTKGVHTITAKIGDQTWSKQVTVEPSPAPPASTGIGDYLWMTVIVVIVIGLVGFGAIALRRK